MTPPDQIAGYVAGFIGFCMAIYERLKSSKKQDKTEAEAELVSDAKRLEERATLLGKIADANASELAKEQEAHQKTRTFYHEKIKTDSADSLKLQEKLLALEARPDYTEILTLLKKQGDHIERMLKLLERPEMLATLQQRIA